jgi:hypothetical protein
VASRIIEELRMRVPYYRRLHREIDDLRDRLAAIEAAPELHPVIGSYSEKIVEQFRGFLRALQPHDAAGFGKRRLGAPADGGYVMLDDLAAGRHALSLGIGTDVSWDSDMAALGYRVFQYDHSVPGSPQPNEHFLFHRRRVVGRKEDRDDITLTEILAQPDLASDRNLIVKIDIDDAEWDLLARTDSALLGRIRQLVIEFSEMRRFVDDAWRATMLAAMNNLTATHACVHIHGNNWGSYTVIGGIPFPNYFETAFVRRADYTLVPSSASFPTELDRPNNPKRPDYFLGRWDY